MVVETVKESKRRTRINRRKKKSRNGKVKWRSLMIVLCDDDDHCSERRLHPNLMQFSLFESVAVLTLISFPQLSDFFG